MLYPSSYGLRPQYEQTGDYELRLSYRGYIYGVGKRAVPRIEDKVLDCSIYLYPSVADAEAGEAVGGSGFLTAVYSAVSNELAHLYAVTCSHVIREGQSPVIRINTKDGAMGGSMSLLLSPKDQTRRLQRRALSPLYSLCSRCIQLQRFAHHAHRVLVKPVQVGLLAQPWRRTCT